ncbi:MAG: GNAT family N-acetyltransferase [Promethearchaeota archaeon]
MSRKKSYKLKMRKLLNKFIKTPEEYIQMKLPIGKITKRFEEMLREKVSHNILGAEIREAKSEDVESILRIYDQSWHSTTMPFVPITSKRLLSLLKNENYQILIANVDNSDSAFAINYLTGDEKEVGVIGILAVIPELQHRGLGTIMGISIWDYFIRKGVKELRCRVYFDNTASYTFLRRLGFEEDLEGEPHRYQYVF